MLEVENITAPVTVQPKKRKRPISESKRKRNSTEQTDGSVDDKQTHKKPRHRKKLLYNDVRKQMEFYFGDANLSKDRFLRQQIDSGEDQYVPLETFLTFNKIHKLTNSLDDIVKAVRTSDRLELNEDSTKIRRTDKIPSEYRTDVDECTIYVESLPIDATHDWLRQIFEPYGTVAYVSLPRFHHTKSIKEFAFIEYEHPDSVVKVIQAFKESGYLLETDTDPSQLCSIRSYQPDTVQPDPLIPDTESGDDPMDLKKSKKKKRKRDEHGNPIQTISDGQTSIRITTKREWKRLRNIYLNLQRKHAKEAHRLARTTGTHRSPTVHDSTTMNFYGARKEDDATKQPLKIDATKKPLFSYESGVIVKITYDEPIDSVTVKTELRQYPYVKYVDISDTNVYVRVDTPRSGPILIKSVAPKRCQILTGPVEQWYWSKMMTDRQAKLTKLVRPERVRKRQKKRMEGGDGNTGKHIRFDE